MEMKRMTMVWFLIVGVVMTTLLVAANPVNPTPRTGKENPSSAMKSKPKNQQLPQGLTTAKLPKVQGKMRRQGKAMTTIMILESNQAITDQRTTKPDPSSAPLHPSPSAALAPLSGQKSKAPPGERKKQRAPADDTKVARKSRGKGGEEGGGKGRRRKLGKEGATEGERRGGGKKEGAREEAIGNPVPGTDIPLQQLNVTRSDLAPNDDSQRYLLTEPVDIDRLQNGGQQKMVPGKAEVDKESVGLEDDSLQLPGATAEDQHHELVPEKAEVDKESVGLDDDSLQLPEATAEDQHQELVPEKAEFDKDSLGLEDDSLQLPEATAEDQHQEADEDDILSPFAFGDPYYGFYDYSDRDYSYDLPSILTKYIARNDRDAGKIQEAVIEMEKSRRSGGDPLRTLDEALQALLASDSSSSEVVTSTPPSLSPSSSSPEEQLKPEDQSTEKPTKEKTKGPNGREGKEGATGNGAGKEKGGGGKGNGKTKEQKKPTNVEKEIKSVTSQPLQTQTMEDPTRTLDEALQALLASDSSSSVVVTLPPPSLSPSSSSPEEQLKPEDQSAGKQATGETNGPNGREGKEEAAGNGGGKGKGNGGRGNGKTKEQEKKPTNVEKEIKSVTSQPLQTLTMEDLKLLGRTFEIMMKWLFDPPYVRYLHT